MLAIDAGIAMRTVETGTSYDWLGDDDLHAPALMWSEARSSLHALIWRGRRPAARGAELLRRLHESPIEPHLGAELGAEAWRIADELGWAKTYDAEYVALASLLGCRLLTLDGRLRRGADRLGFVITPAEL